MQLGYGIIDDKDLIFYLVQKIGGHTSCICIITIFIITI